MLKDVINGLTPAQHRELAGRGISYALLSMWRKEKRLPTEVQVVDVAEATGADWAELQKEVTVLRTPADRREQIAKALHWREGTSSKV